MAEIVGLIADWIMQFLMSVGLWGVFLALAIEAACIPITSEVFLLFAGFLVAKGQFGLVETALVGTAGFVMGSLIPYYLGRKHGRAILGNGGRFLFASERDLDRVEEWFSRHGGRAVLIGRLIPVVRDFISLPAGHTGVKIGKFIPYTALGAFPWIFGVALVGFMLESQWHTLLDVIEDGSMYAWIFIGLLVLALVARKMWHRARGAV